MEFLVWLSGHDDMGRLRLYLNVERLGNFISRYRPLPRVVSKTPNTLHCATVQKEKQTLGGTKRINGGTKSPLTLAVGKNGVERDRVTTLPELD